MQTGGPNLSCRINASLVHVPASASDGQASVYAFGGFNRDDEQVYGDLHRLDLTTFQWQHVTTKQPASAPGPCHGHTAVLWRQKLVLFGGQNDEDEHLNSVYMLDLTSMSWETVVVDGPAPTRRTKHAACVLDDVMYVSGGTTEPTSAHPMYRYAGGRGRSEVVDELNRLCLATWTWLAPVAFVGRHQHALLVHGDGAASRIVAFGGLTREMHHAQDLAFYCPRDDTALFVAAGRDPGGRNLEDAREDERTTAGPPATGGVQRFATVYGDELVVVAVASTSVYHNWLNGRQSVASPRRLGHWPGLLPERTAAWDETQGRIVGAPANDEPFGVWGWSLRRGGWRRMTQPSATPPVFQHLNGKAWHYSVASDEHVWLFGPPNGDMDEFLGGVLQLDVREFGCRREHKSTLAADLAGLLSNDTFADFTIVAEQGGLAQTFPVHGALLAVRWPHFGRVLHSQTQEAATKTLHLPEHPGVVAALLHFVYTDELVQELPVPIAADLLHVAHLYHLQRLQQLCADYLAQHVALNTVARVWECADRIGEEGLRLQCVRFIMAHMGQVVATEGWLALDVAAWRRWWASIPQDTVIGAPNHTVPMEESDEDEE
jgi:hypothetical protein